MCQAGLCLFLAGVGGLLAVSDSEALTESQVRYMTLGLNEEAAIGVPHIFLMSKQTRAAHASLIEKVEQGQLLSGEDSKTYRLLYQSVLEQSQGFLGIFDSELTLVSNHGMTAGNNVATRGIVNTHDHHDVSARKNFAAMLEALRALDEAETSFIRIMKANTAQKQLVDIISHVGVMPHTVSVPYVEPNSPWPDQELGRIFEDMMRAYKSAQFADVHSSAYWAAVDEALKQYNALILAVQARVMRKTTPWERRIAGRFLAKQTLPPPIDLDGPKRPR
jgi:hypothetical protein